MIQLTRLRWTMLYLSVAAGGVHARNGEVRARDAPVQTGGSVAGEARATHGKACCYFTCCELILLFAAFAAVVVVHSVGEYGSKFFGKCTQRRLPLAGIERHQKERSTSPVRFWPENNFGSASRLLAMFCDMN